MVNANKVVTAHPQGFVVYYVDSQRHYQYQYDQPLLPYLKKLQLRGDNYRGKPYQQYENVVFNACQRRLYKDAVYGLGSYSLSQIRSMSLRDKSEIQKIHHQTQLVLNAWKQQLVTKLVDDLLIYGLPGCEKLMNKMRKVFRVGEQFTSQKETNPLSFAELRLSQLDIAQKLVEKGILPANFFKVAA